MYTLFCSISKQSSDQSLTLPPVFDLHFAFQTFNVSTHTQYAFRRVTEGPQKGCYYHDLFSRDNVALVGQIRRMKNRPDTTMAAASTAVASINSQHVASGLSPSPETTARSSLLSSIGAVPSAVGPILDASTASITGAATTQQSLSGLTGLGLLGQLGALGLPTNALGSLSSSSLGLLSSLAPGSILSSKPDPEAISGKGTGDLNKTADIKKHDSDNSEDEDDDDDDDDE